MTTEQPNDAGAMLGAVLLLSELDVSTLDRASVNAGFSLLGQLDGFKAVLHARLTRRLQQLMKSEPSIDPANDIAKASKSSRPDADRATKRADTLAEVPELEPALAAGEVSADHIDVLGRAMKRLKPEQRDQLAADGERLAIMAAHCSPEQFDRRLKQEIERLDRREGTDRFARQRRANRLRSWNDTDTGMVCIRAEFDPETGLQLLGRLETALETLFHRGVPDECPDGEGRQDYLRAMALVALVDGQFGRSRTRSGSGGTGPTAAEATPSADRDTSSDVETGCPCTQDDNASSTDSANSTDTGTDDDTGNTSSAATGTTNDTSNANSTATGTGSDTGTDDGVSLQGPPTDPSADPSPWPADPQRPQASAASLVALGGGRVEGNDLDPAGGGLVLAGNRAEIIVVIDLKTLMDGLHAGSVIDNGHGVELPVETYRRLACEAAIIPVVLNGAGVALDEGRAKRLATLQQRRALRAMYATCAIPGCRVRSAYCAPHHLLQWVPHLGPTDLNNLLPLCSRHHHCVHEGRWRIVMHPDRSLTITYPNGTIQTTGPPSEQRIAS